MNFAQESKNTGKRRIKARSGAGSVMALSLTCLIVFSIWTVCANNIGMLSIFVARQSSAVDSAALVAAKDLSQIVVPDPDYGYIALCDFPPGGKATIAPDGEPLPVRGINSILANARLQMIVSDLLGNTHLHDLAQQDYQKAQRACLLLNQVLSAAIDPASSAVARDRDGNPITPFKDAQQCFRANTVGGKPTIKLFRLSLGWLKAGGSSETSAPTGAGDLQASQLFSGQYLAFTDIPYGGADFYFAGLSQQAALVNTGDFMSADQIRVSSVVKVEAEARLGNNNSEFSTATGQIHAIACAEPGNPYNYSPSDSLSINLPQGLVPGINCLADILNDARLKNILVNVQTAQNGDYPTDQGSSLSNGAQESISSLFAEGFHDWLRTAKPVKIDSIITAVNLPFTNAGGVTTGTSYIYQFDATQGAVMTRVTGSPCSDQDIYQNQTCALSLNSITAGNYLWSMRFRDQVRNIGTGSGGKHCGEAMTADAVNWCDLAMFAGSPQIANQDGKGQMALNITAQGSGLPADGANAISSNGATFLYNGGVIAVQPRKIYYAGGLAVEFELSSPVPIGIQ